MTDDEKASSLVQHWIGKIQREEKEHGPFRK